MNRVGWRRWSPLLVILAAFLLLYGLTAQRGVAWQDSGEFQYRVLVGDYQWHGGLARAHPLYIAGARLFSALFPAAHKLYAVNLFSGLGMVVALGLLGALLLEQTADRCSSLLAMVLLGGAQMCWWLATMAEVYSWSLAFLLGELFLLWRYLARGGRGWLVALAGVNGLHFAIHNIALLNLGLYLVLGVVGLLPAWRDGRALVTKRNFGSALLLALAWLVGALPLLGLTCKTTLASGELAATLQGLLFGDRYQGYVTGWWPRSWRTVWFNWGLAALSLANPLWLLAGRGMYNSFATWRRRTSASGPQCGVVLRRELVLLLLTLVQGVFWIRYFVPDQATFILPLLGLLALWAGLGAAAWRRDSLQRKGSGTAWILLVLSLLCSIGVPLLLPPLLQQCGFEPARSRALPGRDELRYWVEPWQHHETSAEAFVTAVMEQMPAGAWLAVDATAAGALMAAGAAGKITPQWRLMTPWSEKEHRAPLQDALVQGVPLYVVSPQKNYAPEWLLQLVAEWQREGVLYRGVIR